MRTTEDVDVAVRRRPVRHRGHVPGRWPVRPERGPPGQRHAPAVQREPRREAVRRPVVRRLRRHRHRPGVHRAKLRGDRGGRRADRRGGRGPDPDRRGPRLHAAAPPGDAIARTRGGHRLRLAHGRLGQLLRREVQPRDLDAPRDRGGPGRRRPLDRGGPPRLALRRGRLGRPADRARAGVPDDRGHLPAGPRSGGRGDPRSGRRAGRRSSASTSTSSIRRTRPGRARRRPAGHPRAGPAGDPPRPDRHRLRRVRRGRGHPGVRPGGPDGDAGGEPRLRDAVAGRACGGSRADERRRPGGARCRRGSAGRTAIRAAACFTFDADAESPILVRPSRGRGLARRDEPPGVRARARASRGCSGSSTGAGSAPRSSSRATRPSGRRRSAARSATPATRSATTATCTRARTAPTPRSRSARCVRGLEALDEVARRPADRLSRAELGADRTRRPACSRGTASRTTPA